MKLFRLIIVFVVGVCAGIALILGLGLSLPWVTSINANYLSVLKLFLISGACGGILAVMQLADIPELISSYEVRWWRWDRVKNVILALAISAAGGMGGAVAAMFVMILNHNISSKPGEESELVKDVNKLTYIATGVIGGFLGFQLLKLIASNFLQNLGVVEKVTDRKIAEALKKLELSEAITQGLIACGLDPQSPDVAMAMAKLQKALENFPDDRRANILLGRLFRKKKDLIGGIAVLKKGLEAMKLTGSASLDVDRAAINYNLCCYSYLISQDLATVQSAKDLLIKDAAGYLKELIRLNKTEASDLVTDSDFNGIWLIVPLAQILTSDAGLTPPPSARPAAPPPDGN